jgi:hypothetical protein
MSLKEEEAYCPNDCLLNPTFFASAHVVETWGNVEFRYVDTTIAQIVDSKGGWIRTPNLGDGETTHLVHDHDLWTCTKCGTEAKFRKM